MALTARRLRHRLRAALDPAVLKARIDLRIGELK
jgi:hypothetical protein